MTDQYNPDLLKQIVSQIESAEEEVAASKDVVKEHYANAKASGFDTAVLRKVIARRRKDRDALSEEEHLLMTYEEALE